MMDGRGEMFPTTQGCNSARSVSGRLRTYKTIEAGLNMENISNYIECGDEWQGKIWRWWHFDKGRPLVGSRRLGRRSPSILKQTKAE
jgi:hypothetical protein